jgi:ribosomal protein S18 acetylase RimI-like enzyme
MISDGSVQVVFRSAQARDADGVVALVEGAYRGESSRQGWTTEAELLGGQRTDRREVDALLGDARVTIVLAERAGQLVGCVCVRLEPPDLAHVGMFAILPSLQSRGLGRALLGEAERVARERGARDAEMTVLEQRPELLAWYGRRGWRNTGETEPFPYDDPRFGLPRRPDLRFLVLAKSLREAEPASARHDPAPPS